MGVYLAQFIIDEKSFDAPIVWAAHNAQLGLIWQQRCVHAHAHLCAHKKENKNRELFQSLQSKQLTS